jgi:drug/metabolite transporter (DMT)-like permease
VTTILWSIAVSKADKVTTVTNFAFLTPFISILYGFILVAEIPTFKTIIGGLVIIGGSVLFQYFNDRLRNKELAVLLNKDQRKSDDDKQAV